MEMTVMRVHKTGNYTVMSNYHFKEKEMTLKAKGLLSLMLSLPDDWDYSINGLATLSKDGRDSVMGALKELERFGYLVRTRMTDEKGKFKGYNYDIFEDPQTEKPYAENPNTDKPNTENPTQLNTKRINDEGINIRKKQIDKNDKGDKRALAPSGDLPNINIGEPNSFTKELIKAGYIEQDDLFLTLYNQLFVELIEQFGFEIIRSCLWYFIKRLQNGKAYDQNGNEVENKYGYLKTALYSGTDKISNDTDPFSEENINKALALFGK